MGDVGYLYNSYQSRHHYHTKECNELGAFSTLKAKLLRLAYVKDHELAIWPFRVPQNKSTKALSTNCRG